MTHFLRKLSLFHYNIGFFDYNPDTLLQGQASIHWMWHPYKDRFFADPFILDATDTEIKVLVEELPYKELKGKISLLIIRRDTYELKSKKTLLELDTHLSFPFIYRMGTDIYVIPENSQSGRLNAYRYDEKAETLQFESMLIEQPVIDPVLFRNKDCYVLLGSVKGKQENGNLYAWQSDEPFRNFTPANGTLLKSDNRCARRGGDFFRINEKLYSATQSCVKSYGEALNICRVTAVSGTELKEEIVLTIYPDVRYKDGLHTLNQYKGVWIVDGLTFLFRPLEKIKRILANIKR